MKIYRYWAVGNDTVPDNRHGIRKVRVYGAANESMEAAQRRAAEIAARVASALAQQTPPGRYPYSDRALREEIVQEIRDKGQLTAAITRNAYGSLVLNTSRVMFADVDYALSRSLGGISIGELLRAVWDRLRGKPSTALAERDERLLDSFQRVVDGEPNLGMRVYRTAAGFRILVTSDTFEPTSPASARLLTALGSDRLYVRLCEMQSCFRARLSAKFWRCGADRPPSRYPWESDDERAKFRNWEEHYRSIAKKFATCAYVGSFGRPDIHREVQTILETHDRLTILDGAPLA